MTATVKDKIPIAKRLSKVSRELSRRVIDTVLPPQCLVSGEIVGGQGEIAPAYWRRIQFIVDPVCDVCGIPFPFDPGKDVLCASCLRKAPAFRRARSAFVYDDASRNLVLSFKHGDRTDGVQTYAAWMQRAYGRGLFDRQLLVPVPLHYARLLSRRFNQSASLAQALAGLTGCDFKPDLLRRVRRTPQQKGKDYRQRRTNVRKAFAVPARHLACLQGRSIILVDDVFTTGATAEACADTLLRSGARQVDVLTLARVVALSRSSM